MDYNIKPNSHKYKEEQAAAASEERKKLDKVVSGSVKTKKQSGFRKLADEFISDNTQNIKTYIVKDVLIPGVKKAISEIIDMLLYGGSRKSRPTSARISYRDYYDDPRTRDNTPVRTATGYSYDDVIIESRGEAEAVLSQLEDCIGTYGMVSVADLYDLVGISGNYTDNRYGWTNLRNAEVRRVRDGYMLMLPKALPIK